MWRPTGQGAVAGPRPTPKGSSPQLSQAPSLQSGKSSRQPWSCTGSVERSMTHNNIGGQCWHVLGVFIKIKPWSDTTTYRSWTCNNGDSPCNMHTHKCVGAHPPIPHTCAHTRARTHTHHKYTHAHTHTTSQLTPFLTHICTPHIHTQPPSSPPSWPTHAPPHTHTTSQLTPFLTHTCTPPTHTHNLPAHPLPDPHMHPPPPHTHTTSQLTPFLTHTCIPPPPHTTIHAHTHATSQPTVFLTHTCTPPPTHTHKPYMHTHMQPPSPPSSWPTHAPPPPHTHTRNLPAHPLPDLYMYPHTHTHTTTPPPHPHPHLPHTPATYWEIIPGCDTTLTWSVTPFWNNNQKKNIQHLSHESTNKRVN